MAYLLKFGALTLPDTLYVEKWPTLRNVPTSKLARADGARTLSGYLEGKTWSIKGGLVDAGEAVACGGGSIRTQLDTLKAAFANAPATFQTADDRYYRNCQVSQFDEAYEATGFGHFADISFDVVTGDPFAYEFDTHTVTRILSATGQTLAATPGGNAYALGQIALTAGATGQVAATLTNTTNGDICTLTGSVNVGDILIVDSLLKTVTLQPSGADRLTLFDGLFPRLNVGANTLRVDFGTGVALSNVALTWQNRWC